MAVLGKDYLDIGMPATQSKVQFGNDGYWINHNQKMMLYGETLIEILNYDATPFLHAVKDIQRTAHLEDHQRAMQVFTTIREEFLKLPYFKSFIYELSILEPYVTCKERILDAYRNNQLLAFLREVSDDLQTVQTRYVWFLEKAFPAGTGNRKKGQRKIPLADQIINNSMEPFVSGRSLGADLSVDAPDIRMQFAVLSTEDGTAHVVEKVYFNCLADFIYVELMKGLQKGYLPKRCSNCGRWFLQEPGFSYNYCDSPSKQDPSLSCRDIGARENFRKKVANNEIWNIHQRAYRKYYARVLKKTMTKQDFLDWSIELERLRDEALAEYERTSPEERSALIEAYRAASNKL